MKIPTLRRNQNLTGKKVGNFWIKIGTERVNLGTQDATQALKNARRAMKGDRSFTGDGAAAADATIEALERVDLSPLPGATQDGPSPVAAPTLRVLAPVPPEAPPSSEPKPAQQQTAAGWAEDANAAASSAETSSGAPSNGIGSAPPAAGDGGRPRFGDLPFLQRAIVSCSKLAVQIQVGVQVWAWRKWGGLDLAPLEEPPKTLEEFLKRQGVPWADDDPREPGRQVWEGFIKRIIPEELPIPDWLLAPALVAMFTMPVQLVGATPAKPRDEQSQEAAGDPAAAAA